MTAHRSTSRDLALIATFAGVVAALGLVPRLTPPGFLVPITAQSLGVMLAGGILGARRGFFSLLLLLVLVAVGLPLLAGPRGGLGVFAGPSVGFLLGWPVAAYVVGWLTERGGPTYRLIWGIGANFIGGIVVLYAMGIAGIALVAGISMQAATVVDAGSSSRRPGQGRGRARSSRAACTRPIRACSALAAAAHTEPHDCLSRSRRFLGRATRRPGHPSRWARAGTSGRAPAVVRTTDSWVSSFDAVAPLAGLTSTSRVWVPGPLTATMNLFAAVHATFPGLPGRRLGPGDARAPHPGDLRVRDRPGPSVG